MTTRYLVNNGSMLWNEAPISISDGGTGSATQAAAFEAILGSSVIPIVNGGTGSTATPSRPGDIWWSPDGTTMGIFLALRPFAGINAVLTLVPNLAHTVNNFDWVHRD